MEELHLPVEKLDFGQDKPQIQAIDVWPPVARPVLQQDLHLGLPDAVTSTPKVQLVKETSFALLDCYHAQHLT